MPLGSGRASDVHVVPGSGQSSPVGGDEPAGQHVLAVAVGQPQLHGGLAVDAVVDVAQVAVEPACRSRVGAAGAGRHAVVGADDEQVGAVVAQLLEGLERAAGLDVEEAVDHQDREVVDVAAEAALAPLAVERRVLLVRRGPMSNMPLNVVSDDSGSRSRRSGPAWQRRRADEGEHAERRQQVGDAARVEEVAVELVGARAEHRRLDARQLEVQRVVDHDRAGREAVQAEAAVAPRLMARPAEHLGDVLLARAPERVERAVALAGAADVDLEVVEVGAGEFGATRRVRTG